VAAQDSCFPALVSNACCSIVQSCFPSSFKFKIAVTVNRTVFVGHVNCPLARDPETIAIKYFPSDLA